VIWEGAVDVSGFGNLLLLLLLGVAGIAGFEECNSEREELWRIWWLGSRIGGFERVEVGMVGEVVLDLDS